MKVSKYIKSIGLPLLLTTATYAQQPVQLQTVNGGGAVLLGNGVSAGALRVTLGNDSTGVVSLATGANTIGALTANQSVNTAQVNGVTVLTGTGATGTGAQRVTISQDTATIAGSAVGTAGSASANVVTVQGVASMTPLLVTATFGPSTSSSNAFSMKHTSSAAAFNIKSSAGNLYGLALGNSGTIPCWLQLFNSSGTPTAGTSVIDSYLVQAGVSITIPAGTIALENFATGIAAAGATADGGATTTGCTTTFSVTAYYD